MTPVLLVLLTLGTPNTDFFEKEIRPVLVNECYKCHSANAKKLRGSLRLDTREGLLQGGDTGPAIVPGDPGRSLLIRAIRHDDENLRMPPKKRLPASVVKAFEKWVAMGAPDPRGASSAASKTPIELKAENHWAFQPIRSPSLPVVEDASGLENPIDLFVARKLAEAGLSFSPPADRRTLLRRVTYDLIGLPPTVEDFERFERDSSPDAYAKVVDRLLASPRFGERWARHWLDVARYSDTKDLVLVVGKDAIRPFAHTYRDYVIRAFNEDLPYDRFVEEQLAADRRVDKNGEERWRLAAMGFLTLGKLFNNLNIHDIYDDQIDTVTRGLLGLTTACARCHDHKYDPIPTADYYSLHGVFASSIAPEEYPLIADPIPSPLYDAYVKRETEVLEKRRKLIKEQYEFIYKEAHERFADYLIEIATQEPDPLTSAIFFNSLSPGDLKPRFIVSWRNFLAERSQPDDPVFGPWHDLMNIPENELASAGKEVTARWRRARSGTKKGELNPLVAEVLESADLSTRAALAKSYGALFVRAFEASRSDESRSSNASFRQILEVVDGKTSPFYFVPKDAWQYMTRVPIFEYRGSFLAFDSAVTHNTAAPPRAMTLVDANELYSPRIFVRGDPSRPGRKVPRRFLEAISKGKRDPFTTGSGRLDLARSITSPDNPLTSRVLVNRVWMHHIGEPLVTTPSDFGLRSDPPSHPELLDELASGLIADSWSIKRLHRRILLSRTYRQSSADRPGCRAVDTENRLLWRAHRRRLGLEAMRDSFLFVSGRLSDEMFGRPRDIAREPKDRHRTIYGLVDRSDLPTLFRAFDFASPDQTAARRPQTSVPQQALFALNDPFMLAQVLTLTTRRDILGAAPGPARVKALYRRVLARDPSSTETRAALALVAQAELRYPDELDPWDQLAQVLLLTNEFLFVD